MNPETTIVTTLLVIAYLIPTIVILARLPHRHTGPTIVINLLAGWTIIGWIVALALACTRPDVPVTPTPRWHPPTHPTTHGHGHDDQPPPPRTASPPPTIPPPPGHPR